ncbi:MAG TPA: metal ABC transporter ATP-binding protein [Dermatophilaceae bacterium]|nr:metal ABC transporter ATP-binding protein [Dermatophilaceae bacterium]
MTGGSPVLSLRSASFGYADRAVVSGVTLTVEPGEVVAVLGPNGSGKSTLVKGALGLAQQLAGSVELFGMPRADFREHARLGYVPQRHTLASAVRSTVTEIVASGRIPRQHWLRGQTARDREQIGRALELVGLADRARADVTTLSGGQQRRVLIARALAGEPEVLVMDEPMAGVDASAQHVLADVLTRLAATGVTMLVVTHELVALADLVTRVVVVDAGQVSFDGSKADFEAAAGHVLHDHGAHHHDLELATTPALLGNPIPDPPAEVRRG